MLLSCWTCSIFASLLFLHVDSQPWWRQDVGTMDLCGPDTCADGYQCKVDDQGIYCERLGGLDSFGGGTFNINSNNNYNDSWLLNWILRLIRLMASVLQQNRSPNSEQNPDMPAENTDMPADDTDACADNPDTTAENPDTTADDTVVTAENPDTTAENPDTTAENPDTTADDTVSTNAPEETDGPCSSNPCRYNGQCTPDVEHDTVTCKCNYPTSGDTCQNDLGQCTDCVRFGKEVLYLYPETKVTFDGAKNFCESTGRLKMYMPKTKEVSNFFLNYLKDQTFSSVESKKPAFFIGLRRDNKNQPFRWIDNTEVTFSDWKLDAGPTLLPNNNCAALASGHVKYKWQNLQCDNTTDTSYAYYAACSGTYDFFE